MKIITLEYETSKPEIRFAPLAHGQILGESGGYYKVQIIDQVNDVILYEYTAGSSS